MNDIQRFLERKNKNIQKSIVPTGQQANVKIDVNTLPDIHCVMCDKDEFVQTQKMKFMNSITSPNGQEGTVNLISIVCKNCNYLFNIKEWKDKQKSIIPIDKVDKE